MIRSCVKVVKDERLFFVEDADAIGVWLVGISNMRGFYCGEGRRVNNLPWMWSKAAAVRAVRRYKKYIGHIDSYEIMTYEAANLFVKLHNIWRADCDFYGWDFDPTTATIGGLIDEILSASCDDWVLFNGGVTLRDLEYYCFNIYAPTDTEYTTAATPEELFENFRESWDYFNELGDKNIL